MLVAEVLKTAGGIDMFLPDSLHSYSHMKHELDLVWPHLKHRGVLIADDIFVFGHAAISDFAKSVERKFFSYSGMGIIVR